MSGSNVGSRRSLLRASTAARHDRLEQAMEKRDHFATLAAYLDYLLRLHLFYDRLIAAMIRCEHELLERWRLDRHRDWLTADLGHFASAPLAASGAGPSAPRIDCRASAYGAAYVVLGSSLGARILVRRSAPIRGPGGDGFSYLDHLAACADWPHFVCDLEAERTLSPTALVRGAVETFASFEEHMLGSPVR